MTRTTPASVILLKRAAASLLTCPPGTPPQAPAHLAGTGCCRVCPGALCPQSQPRGPALCEQGWGRIPGMLRTPAPLWLPASRGAEGGREARRVPCWLVPGTGRQTCERLGSGEGPVTAGCLHRGPRGLLRLFLGLDFLVCIVTFEVLSTWTPQGAPWGVRDGGSGQRVDGLPLRHPLPLAHGDALGHKRAGPSAPRVPTAWHCR